MTKQRKIIIISIFTAFILSVCLFFILGNVAKTSAQEVFGVDEGVAITQNVKINDTFLNGRKGYEFSTSSINKGFRLRNGGAGEFGISFIPVAETNGVADFTELTFDFSSEESRLGFSLKFMATDNGVTMRLILSNGKSNYKDYAVSGSFTNLASEPMSFYFDPERMVVLDSGKTPIIDLKDEALISQFNMSTLFESYKLYNVDVVFTKINSGKTAKIVVFDICGQSLSGDTLTDTSAPIIFDAPTLNSGVVGKVYKLNKSIPIYDFVDGLSEEFSGEITVYNDLNEKITLADDSFTPANAGKYFAHYVPIDKSQNRGEELVLEFNVLSSSSSVVFNYDYPVDTARTVGTKSKVNFPSVYGTSALTEERIGVTASIYLDESVVYTNEKIGQAFNYVFDNAGEYVVKFKATDVDGEVYTDEYPIKVLDTAPLYNFFIDDEYPKDKVLDLSTATCMFNGGLVDLVAETTYPSGNIQNSKTITLSEIGGYKTEFKTADSDVTYVRYYNVRNNNASLWEGNAGMIVESNVTAPDYADYPYNGTMITTAMPVEAVYKNTIDLTDNTKDDLLCEFFVAPSTAGAIETSCIDIILTDVYDNTKLFNVRLTLGVWQGYNENIMMSAMALTSRDFARSDLASFNTSNYGTENFYYYSTRVFSSFYGKIANANEDYPSQSVKIYFDYNEGKVYADNSIKGTAYGGAAMYGKEMIADLTNESLVGAGKGWKKFTTGEAKLSVKITGITKEAHVMILNVDGQSMSGEYTSDTNAPSIYVDYAGNTEKNLPNGVVGTPYAIFDAYSVDLVDGYGYDVKSTVYKNVNGILNEVEFGNGYFTPQTDGDYVIRYSATDSFGLTAVKDVNVKVIKEKEYSKLGYVFSEKNRSEAFVGESYKIEKGVAYGGTGIVTEKTNVTLNGQKVEVDSDGVFNINKPGEYVLSTVLTDYIKESEPFTFTINASYSDQPILVEKTVPKLILTGEEFIFPEFTAKKYSETNPDGVSEDVRFFINGVEYTDGKFVPSEAGDVVLTVQAGGEKKDYTIHVNQGVEGNKYTDPSLYTPQFLYSNAKSSELTKTAMALTFDQDCEVNVTRLIDKDFINFKLSGIRGDGVNKIECTVIDSEDPSISVTIVIRKKSTLGDAEIEFNDKKYAVDGSFINENLPFKVGISSDGYITSGSTKLAKIEKTDGGIAFNSFASGKVYLNIKFTEVASESVMGIEEISGQLFSSSIKMDRAGPQINVFGDFVETELDQTIVIPSAVAYDFISSAGGVAVTVTAPNGEVIKDGVDISEELTITASQVGTYVIEYSAKDSLGNTSERRFLLIVMDSVPPQITINGEVPTSGEVGVTVELPSMTVTDNVTDASGILSYTYYIAPSGKTVRITNGTFIPEEKGVYIIVYFAQDLNYTTTIQRYVMEVK